MKPWLYRILKTVAAMLIAAGLDWVSDQVKHNSHTGVTAVVAAALAMRKSTLE